MQFTDNSEGCYFFYLSSWYVKDDVYEFYATFIFLIWLHGAVMESYIDAELGSIMVYWCSNTASIAKLKYRYKISNNKQMSIQVMVYWCGKVKLSLQI